MAKRPTLAAETFLIAAERDQQAYRVLASDPSLHDSLAGFHGGPVFAAAVVGAEFANASCRVLLYQNEQGQYVNFGPLRHPRF